MMPCDPRGSILGCTMAATRRAASLVLAITALAFAPWPVVAIDETPAAALPPEAPVQTLPGVTYGAVTVDLDGDGAPELVRLVAASDGSGRMGVDAWRQPSSGDAVLLGERTIHRDASVDEQLSGLPRPAPDGTLPLRVDDAARLLVLNDRGTPRVIVAAIGLHGSETRPCCLTLLELRLVDKGLSLTPVGGQQQDAAGVVVIDLDHDGRDEVVAFELPDGVRRLPLRLYHPLEPSMRPTTIVLDAAAIDVAHAVVADTDGVIGDELLAVANRGSPEQPSDPILTRVSWQDGAPVIESAELLVAGPMAVLPHGGRPLIVISSSELGQTVAARWPAGAPLTVEQRAPVSVQPLTVIGAGSGERLLAVATSDPKTAIALDPTLHGQPYVRATPAAAALIDGAFPGLAPYGGPWPVTPDGSPAYVFGGQLMRAGHPTPMAALPGTQPVGSIGPGGRVTALYLAAGSFRGPAEPLLTEAAAAGSLRLAATAQVVVPEAFDGRLPIGLRGAVTAPRQLNRLVTPRPTFDVMVNAPFGTAVIAMVEGSDPVSGIVGAAGSGPVTIAVDIGAARLADLRVAAVMPSGAGYTGSWRVEQRAGAPALDVASPFVSLGGSVHLEGTTDPDATVAVSGSSVTVDRAGRFSATVSAGLSPSDVEVEATDIVGNRARQVISVVGWVDYRRLPWLGIVIVLTMATGAGLWLMAPGPRRWTRRGPEDDAAFEELET